MCPARMIQRSRPTWWRRLAATRAFVREALDELARLAGRPLASLDPALREAVAMELRA